MLEKRVFVASLTNTHLFKGSASPIWFRKDIPILRSVYHKYRVLSESNTRNMSSILHGSGPSESIYSKQLGSKYELFQCSLNPHCFVVQGKDGGHFCYKSLVELASYDLRLKARSKMVGTLGTVSEILEAWGKQSRLSVVVAISFLRIIGDS